MKTINRKIVAILVLALAAVVPRSTEASPPDPRFGIVESFVNPAAASEAGVGYTRIILRWDVIQPAGPVDWKPANVPDPIIEGELAAGREVVGLLIGTPDWAIAPDWTGERSEPRCSRYVLLGGFRATYGPTIPGPHSPLGHLERTGRVDGWPSGQDLGRHGGGLRAAAEKRLSGDQGCGSDDDRARGGDDLLLGLGARPAALPGPAAGSDRRGPGGVQGTATTSTASPTTCISAPARRWTC